MAARANIELAHAPPHAAGPLGWLRANRNLILFASVLLLIVLLPLYRHDRAGEFTFAAVNLLIMTVSALTNGARRVLFWTAVSLAALALVNAVVAIATQTLWMQIPGWLLAASVHTISIVRLLGEIFRAPRITRDHMFACANAYLLMAIVWCYLYAMLEHFAPGSLDGIAPKASLHASDAIYFSFNVQTSVAMTSVMPASDLAKVVVLLQEIAGVLYMAFVISRLVGQYAPIAIAMRARDLDRAPSDPSRERSGP